MMRRQSKMSFDINDEDEGHVNRLSDFYGCLLEKCFNYNYPLLL